MYMICYCLFQSELGLNQLQRTKISKKFLVFEVSTSNRPFFCADREYAIENCDKRIFWPPEGPKVELPRAKTLQMAISRPFLPQMSSTFFWGLLRPILCLMQKKIEICENLLLRLEFTVFSLPGAPL